MAVVTGGKFSISHMVSLRHAKSAPASSCTVQIVFDATLLIALWVPSAALAAMAKYHVPAARPVISYAVVEAPLTTTD